MAFYKKKPITIEARELNNKTLFDVLEWVMQHQIIYQFNFDRNKEVDGIIIKTLEGDMLANFGDYVIKGVKGEFYPCKPEIFKETYEKV